MHRSQNTLNRETQESFELVREYWEAFKNQDSEKMQAVLAEDAILQDPVIGTVRGLDNIIEVSLKRYRYPGLSNIQDGPEAFYTGIGFKSYEIYSNLRGTETVVDRYTILDGKIVHILGVRCNDSFRHCEGWDIPAK